MLEVVYAVADRTLFRVRPHAARCCCTAVRSLSMFWAAACHFADLGATFWSATAVPEGEEAKKLPKKGTLEGPTLFKISTQAFLHEEFSALKDFLAARTTPGDTILPSTSQAAPRHGADEDRARKHKAKTRCMIKIPQHVWREKVRRSEMHEVIV